MTEVTSRCPNRQPFPCQIRAASDETYFNLLKCLDTKGMYDLKEALLSLINIHSQLYHILRRTKNMFNQDTFKELTHFLDDKYQLLNLTLCEIETCYRNMSGIIDDTKIEKLHDNSYLIIPRWILTEFQYFLVSFLIKISMIIEDQCVLFICGDLRTVHDFIRRVIDGINRENFQMDEIVKNILNDILTKYQNIMELSLKLFQKNISRKIYISNEYCSNAHPVDGARAARIISEIYPINLENNDKSSPKTRFLQLSESTFSPFSILNKIPMWQYILIFLPTIGSLFALIIYTAYRL
ncbi:hypothetical protein HZS_859 [Henneguya salminicola]|nr:hypothetical protein HZS_859 [Henneguya salminicola]